MGYEKPYASLKEKVIELDNSINNVNANVSQLKIDFERFKTETKVFNENLKDTLSELKIVIKEEKACKMQGEIKRLDDFTARLEKRVLAIETKIWVWAGGISAIAFLLSYIIKGIN